MTGPDDRAGRTVERLEERVLVYVDLLGFGTEVTKAFEQSRSQEPGRRARKRLTDLLDGIVRLAKDGAEEESPAAPLRVNVFSDTIIVSAGYEDRPERALFLAGTVILEALWKFGLMARGGAAHGELLHEGQLILGPPLLEAYRLESKVASYPRLLVTDALAAELRERPGTRLLAPLKKGADGLTHLDLFSLLRGGDPKADLPSYLAVYDRLHRGLADASSTASLARWRWLCGEFDEELDAREREERTRLDIVRFEIR